MRVSVIAAALTVLAVSACSPPQPASEPVSEPTPAAVLAGVDLTQPVRALGTEPGWAVNVGATELTFEGMDRALQQASRPEPVIHGTTATFTTATSAGNPMVLTLIATDCSDGMSDRTYPLVARLELGPETLTGCAASTAAIMGTGEIGRVEAAAVEPASEGEATAAAH